MTPGDMDKTEGNMVRGSDARKNRSLTFPPLDVASLKNRSCWQASLAYTGKSCAGSCLTSGLSYRTQDLAAIHGMHMRTE